MKTAIQTLLKVLPGWKSASDEPYSTPFWKPRQGSVWPQQIKLKKKQCPATKVCHIKLIRTKLVKLNFPFPFCLKFSALISSKKLICIALSNRMTASEATPQMAKLIHVVELLQATLEQVGEPLQPSIRQPRDCKLAKVCDVAPYTFWKEQQLVVVMLQLTPLAVTCIFCSKFWLAIRATLLARQVQQKMKMQRTIIMMILVHILHRLYGDYCRVSRNARVYFIFSAGFSFKRLHNIFTQPSSSSDQDQDIYSYFFSSSTMEILERVQAWSCQDSSSFYFLINFFFSFSPMPSINFSLLTFTCFSTSSLTSILLSNCAKDPPSLRKISSEVLSRLLQLGVVGMCTFPLGKMGYSVYINLQSKTPSEQVSKLTS